jgi:hypothetical protein
VALLVAWLEATRWGAALARRGASRADSAARGLPLAMRLLISGRVRERQRAMRHARWHSGSPARALMRLDRTLTWRAPGPRARMLGLLVCTLLASLAWYSGAPPLQARAQSFVGFALASAFLGAWALQRTCGDPPDLIRQLPLSLGALWRARFLRIVVTLALLALLQSLLAYTFPVPARIGQWLAWFLPGSLIATLGLHYAITLQPRTDLAENLYFAWLGVAICASLMIPLMGWGVLIAGVVHSSLRLSRWRSPEVI